MTAKAKKEAQQPLILRAHRLMEAFAKSDDERDFYLDRVEGFIIYVDLEKPQSDVEALEKELLKNNERYCLIPKLTFYETKKIMEGFVNEKVYDIDTKEKLLDIIQSKEARANFLEFIYDHHSELEKWQQYYQERSRIRIIEWLRQNHYHFVFEEDLDLTRLAMERLKQSLFEIKVGKDIATSRKLLITKAKTYYSNEALNPRPKRGRPPKQAVKLEIEPQISSDIYINVPEMVRPFLFIPDISSASSVTFSTEFGDQPPISRREQSYSETDTSLESLQQKLASLRTISHRWTKTDAEPVNEKNNQTKNSATAPAKEKTKAKASSALYSEPESKSKKATPKAAIKPRRIMRPVIKEQNGTSKKRQKPKRIMPVTKPTSLRRVMPAKLAKTAAKKGPGKKIQPARKK